VVRLVSEAVVIPFVSAVQRGVGSDRPLSVGGDAFTVPQTVRRRVAEFTPFPAMLAHAPTGGPVRALYEPVVPALGSFNEDRRFRFLNCCALRHLSNPSLPLEKKDAYRRRIKIANIFPSVKLSTIKTINIIPSHCPRLWRPSIIQMPRRGLQA
jgi:hypothetical protein